MIFCFFVYPSLLLSPLCLPVCLSVCLSIPLSVSLPSVSRTVRPLKLLVYLSARLSAGISVLMLRCRLHNCCLFARPYVCISFLVLSFLYRPTQSNLSWTLPCVDGQGASHMWTLHFESSLERYLCLDWLFIVPCKGACPPMGTQ